VTTNAAAAPHSTSAESSASIPCASWNASICSGGGRACWIAKASSSAIEPSSTKLTRRSFQSAARIRALRASASSAIAASDAASPESPEPGKRAPMRASTSRIAVCSFAGSSTTRVAMVRPI
jgi:hypothetical protein